VAECVLSTLREQKRAKEADRERFVRETRGGPNELILRMMSALPPPPTAAEAESARNQALARVEDLCRLRILAASQ
jgi:hypothetical protein